MSTQLVPKMAPEKQPGLPPILAGNLTPDIRRRAAEFFSSVASLFEAWVTRRKSAHTQRAYREDITSFVRFMGIAGWEGGTSRVSLAVKYVRAFREELLANNAAPKTIN